MARRTPRMRAAGGGISRAGGFPAQIPFPPPEAPPIMIPMERPTFQMTLGAMIGIVACVALNFWLFRLGIFWGILGLNVTKHVLIAYLCQVLGVDRRPAAEAPRVAPTPEQRACPCPERPGWRRCDPGVDRRRIARRGSRPSGSSPRENSVWARVIAVR